MSGLAYDDAREIADRIISENERHSGVSEYNNIQRARDEVAAMIRDRVLKSIDSNGRWDLQPHSLLTAPIDPDSLVEKLGTLAVHRIDFESVAEAYLVFSGRLRLRKLPMVGAIADSSDQANN